ncbi:MAG: sigma 54-interacting transcriptional regulator [Syntrophobacterales bacterium]|nr:sigma 54-interacting transcriptional regulator [Syntrophobacterales bacterium]
MTYSYEELQVLYKIARIIAGELEIRDQFKKVLDVLSEDLGMKRGMISILDFSTGEVWLDVIQGVDIPPAMISYRPGEGITGKVAQTGRPIAVANLGQEIHFLDRTGIRKHLNRSDLAFLCVPIRYQNRVVGILSADTVSKKNEKDLERELNILTAVSELLGKSVYFRAIEEENIRLKHIVADPKRPKTKIIGRSKGIQEVLRLIDQVAMSNMTVLIYGETGTGKELVAKSIHENSPRAKGPLITVNCAAIPDSLIESELFGHEKGAFTGAFYRRKGKFEEAHGGTIFLDEVGELPAGAQAKLLRVLQEREFEPLGSSKTIRVDVRIIAATNRNLQQEVTEGKFRADLYYRLNAFVITIPPLRERGADILLLADYFMEKYSKELGKSVKRISSPAAEVLLNYHWPGNVRELENTIERAILLATGDSIELSHLPPNLQPRSQASSLRSFGILKSMVEAYERSLIEEALRETGGNISKAARLLRTTRRIVQYKAAKYGLKFKP